MTEIKKLSDKNNYFYNEINKSDKKMSNNISKNYLMKNNGLEKDTFYYSKNNIKEPEYEDTVQKILPSEQAQIQVQEEEIPKNQNKSIQKPNSPKKDFVYEDDGVLGYEVSGGDLREEMRTRILSHSALTDENLVLQSLDDAKTPQLKLGSKYYELGVPKLNKKSNQYVHIFENLKDMPDGDGLRGKIPLSGKKGIKFKLLKMKDAGIKRVIDLRVEGECSVTARNALADTGLEYINFPVEDCNWSLESLNNITEYINAVNSGDFYVGCANGQARTDLAVAINYILNPKSKNIPQLYYGSASSTRISVKTNILQILELVKENPNYASDWGWKNYQQFSAETTKKLQYLLQCLSGN